MNIIFVASCATTGLLMTLGESLVGKVRENSSLVFPPCSQRNTNDGGSVSTDIDGKVMPRGVKVAVELAVATFSVYHWHC